MEGGNSLTKTVQRSFTVKTWTLEQSIVSRQAHWTQPWSRVHPEKSRLIKYGDWMHIVMIAIEYSYKLTEKNILLYGAN